MIDEEVLDLFYKGYSVEKASKKLGVTPYKVNKVLKSYNISLKRKTSNAIIVDKLVDPKELNRETKKVELMIASKLFDMFPDINFWNSLKPRFLVPSLKVLFTEKAKKKLDKQWKEYNYVPPVQEKVILTEVKIGEDAKVDKKINLKEFLK